MTAPTLRWPPAADEPRLVTIESFVLIGRPAQAVFEFVTNASLWHLLASGHRVGQRTPPRPLAVWRAGHGIDPRRHAALLGDVDGAGVRAAGPVGHRDGHAAG